MTFMYAAFAGAGQSSELVKSLCTEYHLSTKQPSLAIDTFATVLGELFVRCNDEAAGFLSRPMPLGSFAMMCHALISSPTLGEALERLCRFSKVLSDDLSYHLVKGSNSTELEIRFRNNRKLQPDFFLVSVATIAYRLASWLVAKPLLLDGAEFEFRQPNYHQQLALIFSTEVGYQKTSTKLIFPAVSLQLPVRQTNDTLAQFLTHAPASLLTQFKRHDSYTARVRRLLETAIDHNESLDDLSFARVAYELSIAEHTLRRRLREESHSYQELLDNFRRTLAVRWVLSERYPITTISEKLGFSETAAFSRAFKRWTGQSPSTFASRAP